MSMSINDTLFCNWKQHANTEKYWFGNDTEELYQQNLLNKFHDLKYHNWIDSTIKYNFNSHGFRCKEFTDANSIMFLGCSITLGIGLHAEQIFPNIVANKLNLHCVNLGVGASSADTGFRLAQIYLNAIKPKILVTTFLFPSRTELLTPSGVKHFSPNSYKHNINDKTFYINYYETWLKQPENSELNYSKNILALRQMCYDSGIKYVHINMTDFENNSLGKNSKARDLIHPGYLSHEHISQIILNRL